MRLFLLATLASASAIACAAPVRTEGPESLGLALGGSTLPLRGTALSGAEFGAQNVPGTFGQDYTYPTAAEVDYFVGKGMTSFRIPVLWERLQHAAKTDLDPTELGRLDAIVDYATSRGASVILDPHNYARYYGQVIGSGVGDDVFADFWSRLATHYASASLVVFGLMNEPHDLPTEQWAGAANAAIQAIRATGASNLVLVPGNEWTGASSWDESFYGTPNAVAMLTIRDPGNNYAFEVHQYLDSDFSGTHPDCVSTTIGSQSLQAFTTWLRQNGKRGFLGEFGGGWNPTCAAAVDDEVSLLEANADVYLGWSWWSAGPWWGSYFLSIEPSNGQDAPMMSVLEKHLSYSAPPPPNPMPVPLPPPPPPSPPSGGGALTASMSVTSDWQSGYCVDVHVHNGGAQAVDGWSVTVDAKSSTLTQAWNVQVARQGSTYSATPVGWNRGIAPGADADWGFCANKGSDGAEAQIDSVSAGP